jgi:hypothetical protein
MAASYQFISAQIRQIAQRLEMFAWVISICAFVLIGILDYSPTWFLRVLFWSLFLGSCVSIARTTPATAVLSALIFGVIATVNLVRSDPGQTPLLTAGALICYSGIFLLTRINLTLISSAQSLTFRLIYFLLSTLIAGTMTTALAVVSQYAIVLPVLDYHWLNHQAERMVLVIFLFTLIGILLTARMSKRNGLISY